MKEQRNLFLMSNSTVKHYKDTEKGGWLGAYKKEFLEFIEKAETNKILFVPYARPGGRSHSQYTSDIGGVFKELGFDHLELTGLDSIENKSEAMDIIKDKSYVTLIGGGNTWQLLATIQKMGLVSSFVQAINDGSYMMGISAGTNIFGGDIAPTNDKYVTHLDSTRGFDSLNGMSITPHYENGEWYIDDNGKVRQHSGESMKDRAQEQLRLNDLGIEKILGLPVGAALEIHGVGAEMVGGRDLYLFEKGKRNEEPMKITEYELFLLLDQQITK